MAESPRRPRSFLHISEAPTLGQTSQKKRGSRTNMCSSKRSGRQGKLQGLGQENQKGWSGWASWGRRQGSGDLEEDKEPAAL